MADLERTLRHLIEEENIAQGWDLGHEELVEFHSALLPWAMAASHQEENRLRTLVRGYYRDRDLIESLTLDDGEWQEHVRSGIRAAARRRGIDLLAQDEEELLNSIWRRLFEAVEQKRFRFEARFSTYLYSTGVHETLSFLRKTQSDRLTISLNEPVGEGEAELGELIQGADPPDGQVLHRERVRIVMLIINDLCERFRERTGGVPVALKKTLVWAVLIGQRPTEEVAGMLGINENTAHVIISRFRAKLKEELAAKELTVPVLQATAGDTAPSASRTSATARGTNE